MANEYPGVPKGGPEHDETNGAPRPFVEKSRKKSYELRRAILDYGMGVIIFCLGLVILLAPKLGVSVNLDDPLRYAMGGLFLLYGGFRVYRGRQKNYYNN
ncbi:hypothetical protein [Puia sp.]|jgi:uncharacterized membrane protein|uniref:hypothetical protein n=1 Tax=Puia sp. TaxID=2045100 RepID=UPI002F40B515